MPTSPHPTLSLIVPLYNQLAATEAMLQSLLASLPDHLDYEIILADDGSTDHTPAWLASLTHPRIKTLRHPTNRGYAATCNAAAAIASGDLLALINNDLLFRPGWLPPMISELHRPGQPVGLVGNLQVRVDDDRLDHAGVALKPNGQFDHIRSQPVGAPSRSLIAVTGACILIRRRDFDQLGRYDEAFINGCEDIDLCFKVRAAGQRVALAHHSSIRHHVSLSRKINSDQDLRNSQRLFARWRREIKQELARVWYNRLAERGGRDDHEWDGQFTPRLLATPHAAARVLAESLLRREEAQWAQRLAPPHHQPTAPRIQSVSGLSRSPAHPDGQWLQQRAHFTLAPLDHACNLYLCGVRCGDPQQPIELTLDLNQLQRKSCRLASGRNINVGIVNPLLLPGIDNRLTVTVSSPLLVTHLVVGDRLVGV